MYLLNLFLTVPEFANAIGLQPSLRASLLVFVLLLSPVSTIIGVGSNVISRRHEYAADRFAWEHTRSTALADALIKLTVDNLSNPTPHKFYVFMNYSHPPVLDRLRALDNYQLESKNSV